MGSQGQALRTRGGTSGAAGGLSYITGAYYIGTVAIALCCTAVHAESLQIASTSTSGLDPVAVDIALTSAQPVEGFDLAIAYDAAQFEALAFEAIGPASSAELIIGEFFPATGGATLHVVVDYAAPPTAPIPPGTGVPVATLTLQPTTLTALPAILPVVFADGVYGTPASDNRLIIGGQVLDAAAGLLLVDGSVEVLPPPFVPDLITLGASELTSLESGSVPVLLTNNTGPVEGFVLAIAHDPAVLSIEGIDLTGTVTETVGAEFLLPVLDPAGGTGAVVTVVLDFDEPFDAQSIPVGSQQAVAHIIYRALPDLVAGLDTPVTTTVTPIDDQLGSPPQCNQLLVTGVPTAVQPALEPGTVTVLPRAAGAAESVHFYCGGPGLSLVGGAPVGGDAPGVRGESSEIVFYYTSDVQIQGVQLAVCFDCDLVLSPFSIEGTIAEAVGAEFVTSQIDQDPFDGDGCELIVGLLLDALPPFDGQTIPQTAQPLELGHVTATVRDLPLCHPQPEVTASGITFRIGPVDLGPTPPASPVLAAAAGETVELGFFYQSPVEIQGFQLAVCFDCDLTLSDLSVTGTILETVGIEWINYNIDLDPTDGDGCELVAGLLLDIFPPFDGQTVPPTADPLLIASVLATVAPDAACERFLNVEFCDGIDGAGDVPLENIAIVDFESIQDIAKFCAAVHVIGTPPCDCLELTFCDGADGLGGIPIENIAVVDFQTVRPDQTACALCLEPADPPFPRGDCNTDGKIDLADSASVIGVQFQEISTTCRDACDANDDGLIDLADAVYILTYAVDLGAIPPPPFPECGHDPSEDDLDCAAYAAPCS